MMVGSALGMSDDYGRRAGIGEHFGGDVAGVRAGRSRMAVLRAYRNRGSFGDRAEPANESRRRADHQVRSARDCGRSRDDRLELTG
jgi:hypothetical protein